MVGFGIYKVHNSLSFDSKPFPIKQSGTVYYCCTYHGLVRGPGDNYDIVKARRIMRVGPYLGDSWDGDNSGHGVVVWSPESEEIWHLRTVFEQLDLEYDCGKQTSLLLTIQHLLDLLFGHMAAPIIMITFKILLTIV